MCELTEKAQRALTENGYTCVLISEGEIYHSSERGVKPLLDFLESGEDFKGFFAADKTVGLGAAHLYILLGVCEVWAGVISEDAKALLEKNGISVFYENEVAFIINRKGDGRCPIETAVLGTNDSKDALAKIKQTLKSLNDKK